MIILYYEYMYFYYMQRMGRVSSIQRLLQQQQYDLQYDSTICATIFDY
jgi:hypothetical protein